MVSTVNSYTDPSQRALPGDGYGGVVRVSTAGYYGTGTLLYEGRAILTAAHLFDHGSINTTIRFDTTTGEQTATASRVLIHPDYDPVNINHDLALVWLDGSVPASAERHGLYRDSDEVGQTFDFAGYGTPGTGMDGVLDNYQGSPVRLKASNQFDADIATLYDYLGATMDWTPAPGTQLIADFDSGRLSNDALGRLIYRYDTGLGTHEGLITPGDSGGPAFIDGLVAGSASYSASLSRGSTHPDLDTESNSSFGEIAAWQRVSYYQQWIDLSLRANYPGAPSGPEDVQKQVIEGNSDTTYVYFLLQFTGVRTHPDQWLSVDYETRDGSAFAGEDYLAASGTLILYPDENQAVIPVEIIADTTPEPDQTFYLDVFNPIGGSFGEGVIKLTAARTIVDDDGWMG